MDLYYIFRWLFYIVLRIFFSEIEVIGAENIPKTGALVFVGNHQNQFVDPMLILCHCKRRLGFLIAAKSMTRPIVGFFARSLDSIPVTRALDVAEQGEGTIIIRGREVIGEHTKFTSRLKRGYSIYVSGMEDPIRVDEVCSDTKAILASEADYPNPSKYKIVPKLDHSEVYKTVWQRLGEGGCIGIFPEGGSHDRTQLLPLKAGVTLMALGAMDKYNVPVTIVPVGLNYFSGHKFRSHVVVEFGKSFPIPDSFVAQYKVNKREACQKLLNEIENRLYSVTLNAPDFSTLRNIHLIRRLYQPSNKTLTSDQYMELNRRFALGYIKFKDHPEIAPLVERVNAYSNRLDMLGVKDYHVASPEGFASTFNFLLMLIMRFILLILMFLFSLPGVLFNSPIGVIAKVVSKRQALKAKANSIVKIYGNDVIASYKLIIGFVVTPILYWTYALLVSYYFGLHAGFIFLFVWPFVSYASVKVAEEGVHMWKSVVALLKIRWAATELKNLRSERKTLQTCIRKVVEEFGPKLGPEIWENRIVSPEDLAQEDETEVIQSPLPTPILRRNWRNRSYKRRGDSLVETLSQLEFDDEYLEDVFK